MLYCNADIITVQTMVYWKENQCSIVMRHHHNADDGVQERESMINCNADTITMQTMVYWKENQCSIVMPTSSQYRRWCIGRRTNALF